MMVKIAYAIEEDEIREGLFIPLELLEGHKNVEVEIADDGAVIIRPRKRSLAEIRRSIDRRREALRAMHGMMEDSSIVIREDRDSR
jgi:hypothetical protein